MKGPTYENFDRYHEKYMYEDAERQYHEYLARQRKSKQQDQNGSSNKHMYQSVTSRSPDRLINNAHSSILEQPKILFQNGNNVMPKTSVESGSAFEAMNENSSSVNPTRYSAPRTSLADEIGKTIVHIKNSLNRVNDGLYFNQNVHSERVSLNSFQALEARVALLEQEVHVMKNRIAELETKHLDADQKEKQAS